jgi:predicted PurR-regulated permease PerM
VNRELYFTLLLFAATLLGIYGFLLVLSPFLVAIAWALCLAAVSYPAYLWLRLKLRRPRLAAVLMVVLTAGLILVPLTVVVFSAGEEILAFAEGGIPALDKIPPGAHAWIEKHGPYLGIESLQDGAQKLARSLPSLVLRPVAKGVWAVVGVVFTTVMSLVIMLATLYFVYTEGRRLTSWIRELLPLADDDVDRVAATLQQTTSAAVLGGLLVAFVQGVLAGIGYTIAGVHAPVFWGICTAFFSLIPFGGSALVWVPTVILLYVTGAKGGAWFLLPYGIFVISGVDNILRPWLLRRTGSRIHPMLLFFAILSGIGLFGMSGIVFGPLLIAVLVTLAEIYKDFMERSKAEKDAASADEAAEAKAGAGSGA